MMASIADVSLALGRTPARVGQYIAEGRIPGARKVGKSWLIPDDWSLLESAPADPLALPLPAPHADLVYEDTSLDDWDTWVMRQKSPADARILAQAADLFWRAQERARLERMAQGLICQVSALQTMADDTMDAIESTMGPSLAAAWAGVDVGEPEIQTLMAHLRDDLVARWIAHGLDITS